MDDVKKAVEGGKKDGKKEEEIINGVHGIYLKIPQNVIKNSIHYHNLLEKYSSSQIFTDAEMT